MQQPTREIATKKKEGTSESPQYRPNKPLFAKKYHQRFDDKQNLHIGDVRTLHGRGFLEFAQSLHGLFGV